MKTWRSPAYTTDFLRVLGVHSSRTVPYRLHRCTPSLPVISFVDVNNIFTKSVYTQLRKFFLHNDLLLQSFLIKDMSYIRKNASWTGISQAFRSPEIYKGVHILTLRFFSSVEQVTACMYRIAFLQFYNYNVFVQCIMRIV